MDKDETVAGSLSESVRKEDLPPGLHITLEVIEGPDKGLRYEVAKSYTLLGRKNADLALNDPTVSGKHAALESAGEKFFIVDKNSTNGTTVNEAPVESAPVGNLDVIGLGDTRLLLSVIHDRYDSFYGEPGAESEQGFDPDRTRAEAPVPNPPISPGLHVVLEVIEGADKGAKRAIEKRSTIIGRSEDADIAIDDQSVSGRHCQVEVHNRDKMTIKDLASKNGTRLNDHYISAVKIKHGDVIQIGKTKIKVLIHIKGK